MIVKLRQGSDPRTAAITVAQWTATRDALERTAARFVELIRTADAGDTRAVGEWSIADTAAHVSTVVHLDSSVAAGEEPPVELRDLIDLAGGVEGADVARLNAVALERVNERDLGVLAERIEAGVAHVLDATACRSGSERLSWLAGAQLSVAGVLAHLLSELLVHGFDIARADKRRWPVPPSDAVLAFEVFFVDVFRGIGGSGFVPDDASRSAEFACEFRVRGAEPVVFAYANGELGIQAPGRPVDVRVWGDPAALLLVMFGRVNPAGSLLRGKIVIAGRRPWRLRRLMRLAP